MNEEGENVWLIEMGWEFEGGDGLPLPPQRWLKKRRACDEGRDGKNNIRVWCMCQGGGVGVREREGEGGWEQDGPILPPPSSPPWPREGMTVEGSNKRDILAYT